MRMNRSRPDRGGRSGALVVVLFLVVIGGVGVVLLARTLQAPSGPTPPIALGPAVPATDPLESARQWLRAYRQLAWTDPRPSAWADRVTSVTTGSLAEDYRALRQASGGAEWRDFVSHQCATSVQPLAAVIPPEAPHTPTDVFVLVSGDATTACAAGDPPGDPVEHLAATVELVMGPDGFWRATRRLY